MSSDSFAQIANDERQPLLAGDEEAGSHYVVQESTTPKASLPATPPREEKVTKFWTRLRYYVPSVSWVPQYSLSAFWGDAAAGVTVASIIIPQSISYASSIAKLDPTTGLFAAAIPGIVYALLGTSKHLSVGPESALSLLVGEAVSHIRRGDPHEDTPPNAGIIASTMITFQVGLISFLLGLFRLGFIDVVLSRALQRGFITGVAVVIMVGQLIPLLGLTKLAQTIGPTTTVQRVVFLTEYAWNHSHPLTSAISLVAVASILISRIVKVRLRVRFPASFYVPEIFLIVVVATYLTKAFHWDQDGVAVLGPVSVHKDGAFLQFPLTKHNLSYLPSTTSTAILIAVAGFIESVVAAKQNASRFGYTISPNRESVALGAGNLLSSFLPGTIPAYGALSRSKVNADSGGTTQMASIITSTLVLLAVFFLLPALYYLPSCVLASVILIVVYSLISEAPHDIAYYWRMRAYEDFGLMLLTFLSTILWSVEAGIVVSVTLSLLLVVRNSSKTSIKILGRIPGTSRWKSVDENPEAREDIPGVLIVRLRESLDFANAAQMRERLRKLELYGHEPSHPGEDPRRARAEMIVFHMEDVEHMDASATLLFAEMLSMYQRQGVVVRFAHLRSKLLPQFHIAGCDIQPDRMHHSIADAIRAIESE